MLVRGQLKLNRGFGDRRQKRIRFSGHSANPSEAHPTVTFDLDASMQASYATDLSAIRPSLPVKYIQGCRQSSQLQSASINHYCIQILSWVGFREITLHSAVLIALSLLTLL